MRAHLARHLAVGVHVPRRFLQRCAQAPRLVLAPGASAAVLFADGFEGAAFAFGGGECRAGFGDGVHRGFAAGVGFDEAGLEVPDSGEIRMQGEPVSLSDPATAIERGWPVISLRG